MNGVETVEAGGISWIVTTIPLSNGALVKFSARGIEEVLQPPTHCGACFKKLEDGECPKGHDPWDL